MSPFRSFLSIALVLATAGIAGCKEDPPPPAKPDPQTPAEPSAKGKLNLRNPVAPAAKVDPQTMKEYRVDVCYYGTLTLKQARDAYLASLGKDEPSEKKLPSFGSPAQPTPAAPPGAAPPGKDATKPGPAARDPKAAPGEKAAAAPTAAPAAPGAPGKDAPGAKPGDKAADAAKKPEERKPPFNFAMRAPHERNARACTVAAGLKDPAMGEVDAALAAFAPYAVELAKNIAAAQNYYQREEYKKDNFEKGKELHKKLTADFGRLDELHDKLGAALVGWRQGHPADLSKAEGGQKPAVTAFEDARAVMAGLVGKKIDLEAHKAAVKKLEASAEALKTFGTGNQTDPWAKIVTPSLDGFLRTLKEAEPKITADKGVDPEAFLPVITSFTSLIEAKHRAMSRWLITKGQGGAPGAAPGAPGAAPGAPGAAPKAPDQAPAPGNKPQEGQE